MASALKQANVYKQILLARPIVALANKDLGFLPGDEKQKVAPYMQPLFDNLNVIKGQFAPGGSDARKIDDLQKNGQLVIEALAFSAVEVFRKRFVIIDEALKSDSSMRLKRLSPVRAKERKWYLQGISSRSTLLIWMHRAMVLLIWLIK